MNEVLNAQLVQNAFAAFARGDVASLVDMTTEDVDWQPIKGIDRSQVPTAGQWAGRSGVAEFFQALGAQSEFTQFEPREYIAQGEKVVALGFYAATCRSTGKSYESEWAMVFTIREGKISAFREFMDTHSLVEACK